MTDGGEGVSGWIPGKEWRDKKSKSMKGENNPFYGKQHSDETKALISAKNKGRLVGDKNPMFGVLLVGPLNPMYGKARPDLALRNKENKTCLNTKWYTDGVKSLRCKEGEQPDGFYLGRPSMKKNDNNA
jgi:hypothetical protein